MSTGGCVSVMVPPGLRSVPAPSGVDAHMHIADQPLRLDRGNGIIIDLDVVADAHHHLRPSGFSGP